MPAAEVWPIPDQVSDALAICLGISGTGAYIPLNETHIQAGESVLILGATGPLGQIALQLACESPIVVDHTIFSLDQAAPAWLAQAASPQGKIIVRP